MSRKSKSVLAKILDDYEYIDGMVRNKKTGRFVGNFHKKHKRWQVSFRVNNKTFTFWRATIVWVLNVGKWPEHTIDHHDRDATNDKIENLRDITMPKNWAHSRMVNPGLPRNVYPKNDSFMVIVKGVYIGIYSGIAEANSVAKKQRAIMGL